MTSDTSYLFDGFCHVISYRTNAQHSDILAVVQLSTCTHLDFFQRTAPVNQDTATAWIADDERSLVRQLRCIHQLTQLVLVHRR